MSNKVMDAKKFAIAEWDQRAGAAIRRGKYASGFGYWAAKQLARAGPESWGQLAIDAVGVGGGALLLKGVRAAPLLRGIQAAADAKVPLNAAGRAVRWADLNLGFLRRVGQATGKVVRGARFDPSRTTSTPAHPQAPTIKPLKPTVIQGIPKPDGSVFYPKTREWVFPATVITGHPDHRRSGRTAKGHPPTRHPTKAHGHGRGVRPHTLGLRLDKPRLGTSLGGHRPSNRLVLQPQFSTTNLIGLRPAYSAAAIAGTALPSFKLEAPRLGASLGAAMHGKVGRHHAKHRGRHG